MRLEGKIEALVRKVRDLEGENTTLRDELEKEKADKDAVRSKIDQLLITLDELNV